MAESPTAGRAWLLGASHLARLELRRTLGGGRSWAVTAVLAMVLATNWAPVGELLDTQASGRLARGLLRQAAWSSALLVLIPTLLWHAAGTASRWHAGEGDWLGSRPTGRGQALVAVLLGECLAVLVLLTLLAAAIELRAGAEQGQLPRRIARHDAPAPMLVEPGTELRLELGALAGAVRPGDELRVRVSLTFAGGGGARRSDLSAEHEDEHEQGEHGGHRHIEGEDVEGGPFARGRLVLTRGLEPAPAGAARTPTTRRVASRAWLAAEVPAGEGALIARIENAGPGTLALLAPGTAEAWRPGGGERRGSALVLMHALLALAGGLGLALGLGFWLGAGMATAAVFALLLAGELVGGVGLLPGAALPGALDVVAQGRLPDAPASLAWVQAAICLGLGLGVARLGASSWRHPR